MKLKTSTYSTGNFLWKPMEQMEKFVKHYIKLNSSFWLPEVKR